MEGKTVFYGNTSIPQIVSDYQKEQEIMKENKRMRKVRGVSALVGYLKSINCGMSETTIYRLLRENKIPFNRPSKGVLLFDLDQIDSWLGGDY